MSYKTLDQAIEALYQYIPTHKRSVQDLYRLDRMRALLTYLGNPQEQLRVIHVAGTSGKTSTVYFINALLQAAGQKTGMTVSPHIVKITERLQIDGQPMPDKIYLDYVNQFLPLVEKSHVRPTYFELLVALCYWVFAKLNLDYVVVETGFGGLLDGTNTISRRDKMCVITDIGYDHTELLGETLPEIAYQKAGIIQPYNHAFVQHQADNILTVFRDFAKKQKAVLEIVGSTKSPDGLPGFQQRNWAMAEAAYKYLIKRDGLPELSETQLLAASKQQPPVRMEKFQVGSKTIIIDGAHNEQKITALCEALIENGIRQVAAIVNFKQTKRPKIGDSLKVLRPIVSHLIIPEFQVLQDVASGSVTAEEFALMARQAGFESIEIQPDQHRALKALLNRPEAVVLITGSLYLASQLRPAVLKLANG